MRADSRLVGRVTPSPNHGDRRGRTIDAIVLHYTGMRTGEAARTRLCDPASGVSCHYLVWEDGLIEQLVPEAARAWHAGVGSWAGETDINSVSLGIEIVNAGHEGGCPPYSAAQIEAVLALVGDLLCRHGIAPCRVLAHSDIAPARKEDPGEHFPWWRLAAAGLASGISASDDDIPAATVPPLEEATGIDVEALQTSLAAIGYACPLSGRYDAQTAAVVRAVQRRWRPSRVDGRVDAATRRVVAAVLALEKIS